MLENERVEVTVPAWHGLRSPINKRWLVVDCPFNRANCSELIGKVYFNPPSYCGVQETIDGKTPII